MDNFAICSEPGGYERDFVDTIAPKYHCNICMKVLRDARLTECGQHYCDSCLKKWLERNRTCPNCRVKGFQSMLNKAMIREINEFKIRCTHKEKGCEWVGELGSLKDHLESDNGCGYVVVQCSNIAMKFISFLGDSMCMCVEVMKRRNFTHHQDNECLYRQYTCQYCGYIDTYDAIAGSCRIRKKGSKIVYGGNHYNQCIEYPLKCPNECGAENIKRKEMKTHREICPLEAIFCPFTNHSFKILRKDLQTHSKECDFRRYHCQYCDFLGAYTSITGKGKSQPKHCHYDICEEYPLNCPNKCFTREIKRKHLKKHREKCPLELLDCPFQYAGCTSTKQRKNMDHHCRKSMQEHLLLVAQSHRKLTCENKELVSKVEELSHKNEEMAGRVEQLSEEMACKKIKLTPKPSLDWSKF